MPKKKWGQNFLRNPRAVERIVAAVEPLPGELILEIGPGQGVLTEKLIELGNELRAIEIDPELAAELEERFGDRIVHDDALTATLPERPFRAVGNLPYNVGTPILRRVVASPHLRRAVFMLQKEVADRLTAKPGDEDYGFLTLWVQLYASARALMTLDRMSFYPPPKVRSAVVILDTRPPTYTASAELLHDLISTSFRMRRKKLVNNLIGWHGLDRVAATSTVERAGINPDVRAEELSVAQFDALAQNLP